MEKIWFLWVSRSLENAFETIVDLKMLSGTEWHWRDTGAHTKLSDTGAHTKPQTQSPCTFMKISLYIILLTWNSIPSKIAFPWSQLHLELSHRISYYNCDFTFKNVSFSIPKDTPWCMKSMLKSNLR